MNEKILNCIEETRIVAIVRRLYGDKLLRLVEALSAGGIRLVEVTFDQADPDAADKTGGAIRAIAERFEGAVLAGAGTVLTPEQADAAHAGGAQYIISPNTDADVIRRTKELGLVSMPGAMTPSEILQAHKLGADLVKVFPAIDLGLRYVRNIRAPISHVKLVATAGVNEENFAEFLAAGYTAAGISGRLTDRKVIEAGDWAELTRRAQAFVEIARAHGGAVHAAK